MLKCEECDKEFETELQLRGHMIAHKRGRQEETERKERVPFGVSQTKLSTNPISGKVQRWINDDNDRIDRAKGGAYDHVLDSSGKPRFKTVGKKADGTPLVAYLMAIDKPLYDEDQAAKEAKNAKLDEQIHNPNYEGGEKDNRYIPKQHPRSINVTT